MEESLKEEEIRFGEKVASMIFAGGSGEAIARYCIEVINDVNKNINLYLDINENGDVVYEDRLGRIRFYDGDISAVNNVRGMGIPSRHIYRPAGRRARALYLWVVEEIERGTKDTLKESIEKDELNQFTIVICQAAVSGAGYVICRRLSNVLNSVKPFSSMIRVLILPSKLEPGVEDSIRFFLEEDEKAISDRTKTIIVDADVAYLVFKEFIQKPTLDRIGSIRREIVEPSNLLKYVKYINFDAVDRMISVVYAELFLGSLIRDLRLVHEGNVKKLDAADVATHIGDGRYFTLSIFNVEALGRYRALDDVVALGTLIPATPDDSEAFLESYSAIFPSRRWREILQKTNLSREKGRITGIALSEILNRHGLSMAFVKIDKNKFANFYERFIGVL